MSKIFLELSYSADDDDDAEAELADVGYVRGEGFPTLAEAFEHASSLVTPFNCVGLAKDSGGAWCLWVRS